ncbi:MAG: phage/plasmid primase, P4 family [Bacillota bacterium]|nr:phage/plasmid primase, P4 family [Bacillota bacterium]
MSFNRIPNELKQTALWSVWKRETDKNGRITKIPYNPRTGGKAQSNNPDTFTSFDIAVAATQSGQYSGIGIGIFNDICAIDIDHCVNDGKLSEMAQDIIDTMNTYTEYSPSGEGIRILFTVKDLNYNKTDYYINKQNIGLEVYVAGVTKKYVTVTGNVISAGEYGDRTDELQSVLNKYMKRKKAKQSHSKCLIPISDEVANVGALLDHEVLSKARSAKNGAKFNALYNGDITSYNSHSEADLALCNILAFWCRRDIEQMDRLFRASGLYREKWDRRQAGTTYGRSTLETAINNCNDVYSPKKQLNNSTTNLKPRDFTDVGQAQILTQVYGDRLRYSEATKYLFYDGMVWMESNLKARSLVQELTKRQLKEARTKLKNAQFIKNKAIVIGEKQEIEDAEDEVEYAKKYYNYAISRRFTPRIDATLKEAQPMLEIDIKILDAAEFKLNTTAGIVDLKTSNILPHKSSDYCTKITAVSPTNEGTELFSDFLKVITCNDKSLEEYLQLIAGMFAVGKVFCENLVIAYGSGRNGKSTFFNLLALVMGNYSGNLSAETLTANCRKNKSPEYAELRGKRLVIAAELEEGMRLDTAIVKKLCSTDPILAEKKYKDPFSFTPSHTVVLYTNHLPQVRTSDAGTWRRLIVIPFNAIIEGEIDIKNYCDYLLKNAGGAVLSWIIEGAQRFIAAKYTIEIPGCVKQAIQDYRADNDWVSSFILDCCEIDKTFKQEAGDLQKEYRNYCSREGELPKTPHDFKAAIEGAGFKWQRSNNGAFYFGLRLLPKQQTFIEQPSSSELLSMPHVKPLPFGIPPLPPLTVTEGDGEIQNFSEPEVDF